MRPTERYVPVVDQLENLLGVEVDVHAGKRALHVNAARGRRVFLEFSHLLLTSWNYELMREPRVGVSDAKKLV